MKFNKLIPELTVSNIEKEIIVLDPDGYMLRFSETIECEKE